MSETDHFWSHYARLNLFLNDYYNNVTYKMKYFLVVIQNVFCVTRVSKERSRLKILIA